MEIQHERLTAPHKPPTSLPFGSAAIYVFSLSGEHGSTCAAGANRVIKVGLADQNTRARFCSQHYSINAAPSTLSGAIYRTPILWPYLGLSAFPAAETKAWLCANTDRDHFFLPGGSRETLVQLERYLKGRLGPVFEGMSARITPKPASQETQQT